MTESKIELTERLRREGRWPEAMKFKDTALRDFRCKGMKRDEAAQAAWEATATAYPPLAPIDQPSMPPAIVSEPSPAEAGAWGWRQPLVPAEDLRQWLGPPHRPEVRR